MLRASVGAGGFQDFDVVFGPLSRMLGEGMWGFWLKLRACDVQFKIV